MLVCTDQSFSQKVKPVGDEDWEVVASMNVAPVKKSDGTYDEEKISIAGKYYVIAARNFASDQSIERFYAAACYGEKKEASKIYYIESLATAMLNPVSRVNSSFSFRSRTVGRSNGSVWLMANRFGGPLENIKEGAMHYFDARFQLHTEVRAGRCFVVSTGKPEERLTSAKIVASFVFETPIPELNAKARAKYGANPKFRYKVSYIDKSKDEVKVQVFDRLGKARRGIRVFAHEWKIKDGNSAKYKVVREYEKAGKWISEEGGDMAGAHAEIVIELTKDGMVPPPR